MDLGESDAYLHPICWEDTMNKQLFHEISLPLDDTQDLFVDPEPGSDRYVSGMDYLYSEIKTYSRHEKVKVVIELLQENITEGLGGRTREKMKRYCQFKIEENHKQLIALRHQGFALLWIGLIVSLICLVIGGILYLVEPWNVTTVLGAVPAIIVTILVIVIWIAMSIPLQTLLFDWWPFRRDIRIYEQIAAADLVIRESGG
jgi:hypothetical protein